MHKKNPKQEFKREAFELFERLIDTIKFSITEFFFKVEIKENKTNALSKENYSQGDFQTSSNQMDQTNTKSTFTRDNKKIGRNENVIVVQEKNINTVMEKSNLPTSADFKKIDSIKLATTCAGLKKKKNDDLLLIIFPENSTVSAVFTRNKLAAAPVLIAKKNLLSKKKPRAIIVNSSIANSGTGKKGLEDVIFYTSHLAKKINCHPRQILPFSTGVIMEYLPIKKMVSGINALLTDLSFTDWDNASKAIMTTDTKIRS